MTIELTPSERAQLAGEGGPALQTAMRIVTTMAEVYGAERLLEVESAHIDGCLLHGFSGVEFAERLVAEGGEVCVPTTLNVGALDLLHPGNFRGDETQRNHAQRLMNAYETMGCRPTWSCAPYQAGHRPALGTQVAWAESNAIVFVNSVLGARTERYGDFIDICAALTGRAPAVGLHLTENRRGQVVFDLTAVPRALVRQDVFFPVLGYLVGRETARQVPVILGLETMGGLDGATEDQLKALGAAAASSGAVALFHAVGVTPEAPTLAAALHGERAERVVEVSSEQIRAARDRLSTVPGIGGEPLAAMALGSPHFSYEEFRTLMPLVRLYPPSREVECYVCTHRLVYSRLQSEGVAEELGALGVRLVVDTCVVVTPILESTAGTLMTNSGKFAHYTPGNTGLDVVFGSLEECVRSAHAGKVWRDPALWGELR